MSRIDIPQLTKLFNESLILAVLFNEKKHGYQIALEIEQRSDGLFKLNHGTLYPILHKLEKEGHIKGVWKQEGPKRQRKYYNLTAKGRKYITGLSADWRTFMRQFYDIIDEVEK
ncbi:helix-turn-helix transcriptional regulator [candidate division KSB1 bacterium]|nr:helix-turn-helix transcriptional regulator [candidate division KSB1 bacterium]